MPRTKSAAQAAVSDGSGGMVALEDHRFDDGAPSVTVSSSRLSVMMVSDENIILARSSIT